MKTVIKTGLLTAVALLSLSGMVWAGLKVVGAGDNMRYDPANFPPEMKDAYNKIMAVKCIKCHTLERLVESVRTGIAPISGLPFDKGATKAYGIKMMRKPDSDMSKADIKTVVPLMDYLIDEAKKK